MVETNLINGDCIMEMQKLPTNSVDAIFTSPPYNVGIKYASSNDSLAMDKYFDWTKTWLSEAHRILKPDGRIGINHLFLFGNGENRASPIAEINSIGKSLGFKHHGTALWMDATMTKRTAWGSWLSASAPYLNTSIEGILVLFKERWKKDKGGKTEITKDEFMETSSGLWKIQPEKGNPHPAPFPVKLPERFLRFFTFEGETILDPFMGSGTTGVAATRLNRNFIGIELDKGYYEAAEKRIKEVKEQSKLML